MACSCAEGRFERTMNNFAGRNEKDMHPHAKTFLKAKPGTVCAAPPVHDCTYIRVRNSLSHDAMHEAYEKVHSMKEGPEKDGLVMRHYQEAMQRLVTEYYRMNAR